MNGYQITGGSVPGTEHTKPGQPGWCNNQDAFAWRSTDEYLVAIVSDGCSSAPYSETGAQLAAHFLSTNIAEQLAKSGAKGLDLGLALAEVIQFVRGLSLALGAGEADVKKVVLDRFLFTVVGVAMDQQVTTVFSLGDGVFAVNGELQQLGPFPNNEPPYLAYNLLTNIWRDFSIASVTPTCDVHSLMIGTDGVLDLAAAAQMPMPGREEVVGPLSQFWEESKYVQNADNIRRRLALANRETADGTHVKKGLLPDDTTLVIVRREATEEDAHA